MTSTTGATGTTGTSCPYCGWPDDAEPFQVVSRHGTAAGSTVWFTAFWRNPKDQSGPATTPVSTKVQWGGLSMAA